MQDALAALKARKALECACPEDGGTVVAQATPTALSDEQRRKALARADLVRLYVRHLAKHPHGRKVAAREEFVRAYLGGAWPEILEVLGKVSWKSIERWKRTLHESGDPFRLADFRGRHRRGAVSVTDEQRRILIRCALHPGAPRISEAIRRARAVMRASGIEDGRSDSTYRRVLKEYKDHHYHIWTFTRRGAKAWNDECAYYIERDMSVLNVGDVLVADGHILNFEILNPWTGKPKRMVLIVWYDMRSNYPCGWEIMPTENTQAIASAFRRAVIALGKVPAVAYLDNGKAFGAKYFTCDLSQAGLGGLFERLGTRTIFAWPYHGQSKPLERFFGTFAELERWMPSYTGTSIDNKPPRLKRGERLHRAVWDKQAGRALTMEEAHWAVAAWFDEYARRPSRAKHLDGAAPIDVFRAGRGDGVDEAVLRDLMLAAEIRTIGRNGIRWRGCNYYHPELYGRRHPVVIRYDWLDPDRIHVYGQDGAFICTAERVRAVHPAAGILGTDEDRALLEEQIALKRRQEREASTICREMLERQVLPEYRRLLASTIPGIDGNGTTASGKPLGPRTPALEGPTDAEIERIRREVAELEAMQPATTCGAEDEASEPGPEVVREDARDVFRSDDLARYERLVRLEVSGRTLSEEDRVWMRMFELSPEYRRHEQWFDDLRLQAAVDVVSSS
ncbi:Mu transposase C-terminal domain-containing protein [Desulfacinum hydrothermale]|uniref:Mu transposase C-terminal domain-containing protein n=1 Tax=Desulfacinum hydrothermale TaxID=109258 RepID=UPI0009FDFA65|nr:Mu transposase C-terminal domain-containing protein [Desulfacinum hydrothermale]